MDEKKLIEQKIFNDTSKYNDIMDVDYRHSKRHLPMNQIDRAAQFAPFGALQGFHESIQNKTDNYENKQYLNYQQEQKIVDKIKYLQQQASPIVVDVTYFNDESGFYEHVKGPFKKIEPAKGRVTFGNTSIVLVNIRNIKKWR